MSVDQMLWHVNQFLAASIGEGTLTAQKSPMPAPLMKFFLIYMPWPKSAPTNKSAVAEANHDLEAERARCKELIAKFVSRPVNGSNALSCQRIDRWSGAEFGAPSATQRITRRSHG